MAWVLRSSKGSTAASSRKSKLHLGLNNTFWPFSCISTMMVQKNTKEWLVFSLYYRLPNILCLSRLLPLFLPLALEGARIPSTTHSSHHQYAHLPSPRQAHQQSLDSRGLNYLCHYLTYICLFPIKCLTPRTCFSSPVSLVTDSITRSIGEY